MEVPTPVFPGYFPTLYKVSTPSSLPRAVIGSEKLETGFGYRVGEFESSRLGPEGSCRCDKGPEEREEIVGEHVRGREGQEVLHRFWGEITSKPTGEVVLDKTDARQEQTENDVGTSSVTDPSRVSVREVE